MSIAELDGRIGEGWGGLSPERVARQRRARAARQPDGGRRDLDVRPSVARPLAGALLRRRIAARVPADLAADADDEQGDGARRPSSETMTWGAGPARHRPGCARLGRRRPDRGIAATSSCSSRSGSTAGQTTRRPFARRRARRSGKAIRMCVEGRDPDGSGPARGRARLAPQPVLQRRLSADHGGRDAALPLFRSSRRFVLPGIRCRASTRTRRSWSCVQDDGVAG